MLVYIWMYKFLLCVKKKNAALNQALTDSIRNKNNIHFNNNGQFQNILVPLQNSQTPFSLQEFRTEGLVVGHTLPLIYTHTAVGTCHWQGLQ